jgi:ferritin-like metal-binding protein YciE
MTFKRQIKSMCQTITNMEILGHKFGSLRDLYVNELRNLFSAETQLVEALPKMADGATAPALKQAFTDHLAETRMHVERLDQIFKDLSKKAMGETCEAMKALIKEAELYIKAEGDDDVHDAGLIGAAQRIEHYEIAAYGTARALAFRLSDTEAADSLQTILNEEGAVDQKLTAIAESGVNINAGSPVKAKSEFDVSIF